MASGALVCFANKIIAFLPLSAGPFPENGFSRWDSMITELQVRLARQLHTVRVRTQIPICASTGVHQTGLRTLYFSAVTRRSLVRQNAPRRNSFLRKMRCGADFCAPLDYFEGGLGGKFRLYILLGQQTSLLAYLDKKIGNRQTAMFVYCSVGRTKFQQKYLNSRTE